MSRSIDAKSQLWAKRFREFDASSLSVTQFCQSVGCSVPSFYHWKRKLALSKGAPAMPSFLQVQTNTDCSFHIKLVSGVTITLPFEALDSLPQILNRIT